MKHKEHIRFVNFQIVTYDFPNGDSLTITPIPPNYETGFTIKMDNEKYLIETRGNFNVINIHEKTLENFANFLSDYFWGLQRLT